MKTEMKKSAVAPTIAIVGATGAVGEELLRLIDQRGFAYSSLSLVASARSAGKRVAFQGKEHAVEPLEAFDFSKADIAFFSAGTSVSKVAVDRAAKEGALIIDNTNAFRMAQGVPLVVPQVNAHVLESRPERGIVANPNCSTIQMVRAVAPIRERYGVRQIVASTYQAASGAGKSAIAELYANTEDLVLGREERPAVRFAANLAFNVVPQIDVLLESGFSLEEQKMVQETRKILDAPDLQVTATAVRVPVVHCHSEAVYIECERDVDRAGVVRALSSAPELRVHGEGHGVFPTPRFLDPEDHVHVGRIRVNPDNPRGLWLWVVAHNLLVGAALNAIQIAEHVRDRYAWRSLAA